MKGERVELTPHTAWFEGTNLRAAVKEAPQQVRGWLALQVTKLVRDIDAKKTISTNEEIEFVCRQILEDHPTIRMEEVVMAFERVRSGKFKIYERLKAAEILTALREYEGSDRAEAMERHHYSNKHTTDVLQYLDRDQLRAELDKIPGPQTGIGTQLRKHLDKQLGPLPEKEQPKPWDAD